MREQGGGRIPEAVLVRLNMDVALVRATFLLWKLKVRVVTFA